MGEKMRAVAVMSRGKVEIVHNVPKPVPSDYGLVADHKAMLEDGFSVEDLPYYESCGAIPKDFEFTDGGVLLSLLECYSAVKNFGICEGMDVLVYGAGPVGLAIMNFTKIIGANSVTVIDGIDERLERATDVIGVNRAINFMNENVNEVLKGELFDAVIDAVGSTKILVEASARLKQGGKLCALGVLKKDDAVLNVTHLQNNTSLHMLNFPYKRFSTLGTVLDLISKGLVNPKDYYSHVMPVEEIYKCMDLIKSKEALKVVLTFD